MTRRRRAAVLIGLSLILGALAAGARLGPAGLAVRHVPSRYAPAGAYRSPDEVNGLRAAVAIPAGTDLDPSLLDDGTTPAGPSGPALRAGERVAQVVAIGSGRGAAR